MFSLINKLINSFRFTLLPSDKTHPKDLWLFCTLHLYGYKNKFSSSKGSTMKT